MRDFRQFPSKEAMNRRPGEKTPPSPPDWNDPQIKAQLHESARIRLMHTTPPFQPVEAVTMQIGDRAVGVPGLNKREWLAGRIFAQMFIGRDPRVMLNENTVEQMAIQAIAHSESFFRRCAALYAQAIEDMADRIRREEENKHANSQSIPQ